MHLSSPQKAAREILRVLKPSGKVLSLEADWDTLVITTGSARRSALLKRLLRNNVRHPGIGHALPVLFQQAGFRDITVGAGTYVFSDFAKASLAWRIGPTLAQAVKANHFSRQQAETFMQDLAQDSAAGKFLAAATGFYLMGRRPER